MPAFIIIYLKSKECLKFQISLFSKWSKDIKEFKLHNSVELKWTLIIYRSSFLVSCDPESTGF